MAKGDIFRREKSEMFYDVHDVMEIFGCSVDTAYKKMKLVNDDLVKNGMFTFKGLVSKKIFNKRFALDSAD